MTRLTAFPPNWRRYAYWLKCSLPQSLNQNEKISGSLGRFSSTGLQPESKNEIPVIC
jgi:hypothetical protein